MIEQSDPRHPNRSSREYLARLGLFANFLLKLAKRLILPRLTSFNPVLTTLGLAFLLSGTPGLPSSVGITRPNITVALFRNSAFGSFDRFRICLF